MPTASILHVGEDFCHRVAVMEQAGFAVVCSECSAAGIRDALAKNSVFSALTFHNDFIAPCAEVVAAARMLSEAALVLFRNEGVSCDEAGFDLVIAPHCSPMVWLKLLEQAIEQARNLRQAAQEQRQDCEEARPLCQKFRPVSARMGESPMGANEALRFSSRRG